MKFNPKFYADFRGTSSVSLTQENISTIYNNAQPSYIDNWQPENSNSELNEEKYFAAFKDSDEFENMQRQFNMLMRGLKIWCQENNIQGSDSWDTLQKAIVTHRMTGVDIRTAIAFYGAGKRALEAIYFVYICTTNTNVDKLKLLMQSFINDGRLALCVAGAYIGIMNLSLGLGSFDWRSLLLEMRSNYIQQLALEFTFRNVFQSSTQYGLGTEIHFVNSLWNFVHKKFDLPHISDVNTTYSFSDLAAKCFESQAMNNIAVSLIEQITQYLCNLAMASTNLSAITNFETKFNLLGLDNKFNLSSLFEIENELDSKMKISCAPDAIFIIRCSLIRRFLNNGYLHNGYCCVHEIDASTSYFLIPLQPAWSWREQSDAGQNCYVNTKLFSADHAQELFKIGISETCLTLWATDTTDAALAGAIKSNNLLKAAVIKQLRSVSKYSAFEINSVCLSNDTFDHKAIPVPLWFQPFWNQLMTKHHLCPMDSVEFKISINKIYQALAPVFDEYEAEKDYVGKSELYAIYIKTFRILIDEIRNIRNRPGHVFGVWHYYPAIIDLIPEMSDLEFIKELIKHEYFARYADTLIKNYINLMLKQGTFDTEQFIKSWYKRMDDQSTNDLLNTGLVQAFIDNSSMLNPNDLLRLLPTEQEKAINSIYRFAIVYSLSHNKPEFADFFLKLLPPQTEYFSREDADSIHKPYKQRLHFIVNNYVFEKQKNPEFAYSWASSMYYGDRILKKELLLFAAAAGNADALDLLIKTYEGKRKPHPNTPFHITKPEYIAAIENGADMQNEKCVKLLAEWLKTGSYLAKDLPRAIKLYLQVTDYQSVADIYRYAGPSIENNFEAFKNYSLAFEKTLTAETHNNYYTEEQETQHISICFELAISYLHGLGTEVNVSKGIEMLHDLGSKHNFKQAYLELAEIYRNGIKDTILVDLDKAKEYYLMGDSSFAGRLLCAYTYYTSKSTSTSYNPTNSIPTKQRHNRWL